MATALQAHIEASPNLAQEIEALIAKLPSTEAKQNTITQTGDENIAVQDVQDSKININK